MLAGSAVELLGKVSSRLIYDNPDVSWNDHSRFRTLYQILHGSPGGKIFSLEYDQKLVRDIIETSKRSIEKLLSARLRPGAKRNILDCHIYAARMQVLACRKFLILSGKNYAKKDIRSLRDDFADQYREYVRLWHLSNKPLEIEISLKAYRKNIDELSNLLIKV